MRKGHKSAQRPRRTQRFYISGNRLLFQDNHLKMILFHKQFRTSCTLCLLSVRCDQSVRDTKCTTTTKDKRLLIGSTIIFRSFFCKGNPVMRHPGSSLFVIVHQVPLFFYQLCYKHPIQANRFHLDLLYLQN